MSRMRVRVRVTLVFVLAMTAVISGLGVLLYSRFAHELDATINDGLRARASTLSALAREPRQTQVVARFREQLAAHGESYAQVIAADGRVLLNAAPYNAPLLVSSERARALRGALFVSRSPAVAAGGARLLAVPVD